VFSLPESPRLRRILLAYTVNQLGTWFGYVALSIAVYDHTHSAVAVAGLLISARFLPALAVPALVARVESSRRRGELSGLYLVEAVTTAALAVLLGSFWLPAVFLLVAIDGTAALAANALVRAAAAREGAAEAQARGARAGVDADATADAATVGARRATAALNIGYTATVVAAAAAGLVVAALGPAAALYIDAASFVVCAALLIDLHPHIEEAGRTSVRQRLAVAWEHLGSARRLRALLLVEATGLVFFAFSQPIEVLYAKDSLRAGDVGYGILIAVWGVGMVIGSLIFARSVRRPLSAMLTGGTLAVGLAYLGFAAAPTLAVACGFAVLGGIGNGMQWASLISAVQQLTPPLLHGRLMGAVESVYSFCLAAGFLLGGLVAAFTSPRGAYLVAGLGASLTTVAFMRLALGGLEPSLAVATVPPPGRAEPIVADSELIAP